MIKALTMARDLVVRWKYGALLIIMVLVFAYVLTGLGNQQRATDELVARFLTSEIEDDYDVCLSRKDVRRTLYGLLDAVVEGSIPLGVALDLVSVPGYGALDPSFQQYLINLDAYFDAGNDEPSAIAKIRDVYKTNNPIPDCEAERLEAQRALEVTFDGN